MTAGFHWLRALGQPGLTAAWPLQDWQRVIRLARRLRLLGRLAEAVVGAQMADRLPPPVQQHLMAELRLSRFRLRTLSWTAAQVRIALADCTYPCVLLKGGAYAAQGLPIAPGRLPSDLDLMVPKASVADAQARLRNRGWEEVELDAHDQMYYREWSHEVPPMRHPNFGMELDLHHTILPPVARTTVDAELLFARLQPSGLAHWRVLCPVDQVLHSAAHLFFDSELRDRLRDLVDLDGLMRHFAQRPGFWLELLQRAQQLGLGEPLALACHYTHKWLDTPIPEDLLRDISRCGPGTVRQVWLMPMFDAVLTPTEPDAQPGWRQDLAATGLLARHHLLRMPLHLLLPHLWHKAKSRRRRLDDGDDGF